MSWLLVALLACSSPCGAGWLEQSDRAADILRLAEVTTRPQLCFGRVPEMGVRASSGVIQLNQAHDDRLLAARVRHLVMHQAVDAGPDCVVHLLREEAKAWSEELTHRQRLGVGDPHCPVATSLGPTASVGDIEQWLATAPHPRAAGLRASHRRRCSLP